MRRVYRYRLSPTPAQERSLHVILGLLRELYNACLQERRDAYKNTGKGRSHKDQQRAVREVRDVRPEFALIHYHLLQDTVKRIHLAFEAFFRRVAAYKEALKNGQRPMLKPGYPRFKGHGRYRTFTFKDAVHNNGAKLVAGGKRLRLHGIGNVRIKLHRPYQGTLKQVSVTLDSDGHWYAALICDEVPAKPLPSTGEETGIDVGLAKLATLADGSYEQNPRFQAKYQRQLATAQRKTRRRKFGGKNRAKARRLEGKVHAKLRNVRKDFQHKLALQWVRKYDKIAFEELNLKGLASSRLAKQIHDAAWGQLKQITLAKAESAGRVVVSVDPRGTSQRCSTCDVVVKKDLATRVHSCPSCGYFSDRDHNAARNILRLGRSLWGGDNRASNEPRSPALTR